MMKIDVNQEDSRLGTEFGSILKNALVVFHALTSLRRETNACKEKRRSNMDKRKAIVLLTVVAAAAIMSGIILTAYSADNGESTTDIPEWGNMGTMMPEACGGPRGRMGGHGDFGFIEVSDEFKENVLSIANADSDIQALLADSYNITQVRPIIKSVVEADGTVVTKATSAIVLLEKDTISRATALVDIEEAKVTEIVILTRTVIDKS